MLFRTSRFLIALLVVLAVGQGQARAAAPRAHIVLIGEAGSEELAAVLSELLEREGVTPELERRARFRASALLSEGRGDARVWVFIAEPGPHVAKLYFRGPGGERFLLRRLSLKSGLDELGRELVAQVVETSTVALLRSDTGVSREEARAGLSAEGDPGLDDDGARDDGGAPAPDAAAERAEHERSPTLRVGVELSARGTAAFRGSDLGMDHAVGAETGLSLWMKRGLFVRARLAFERGLGQSLEASGVQATLRTTALRGGVDLGTKAGASALCVGVSAGADLVRLAPVIATDTGLVLSAASSSTAPILRAEARYELHRSVFQVTAGVFADTSLVDTHYDLQDAGGPRRVAEPARIRPGLALTLGLRFFP